MYGPDQALWGHMREGHPQKAMESLESPFPPASPPPPAITQLESWANGENPDSKIESSQQSHLSEN